MTDLSQLIERVEAATGPDRELDVAIILALHPEAGPYFSHCEGDEPIFWNAPYRKQECPRLTTSIDATRSIPPGALCVFASDIGADGLPMVKVVTDTGTNPIIEYTGIAATLELAWCAAILKAKQAEAR